MGVWTGFIWFRIGMGGELLWMRKWTLGFHKLQEISCLAENQFASQEGLRFTGGESEREREGERVYFYLFLLVL